jgi:hypothetical protein
MSIYTINGETNNTFSDQTLVRNQTSKKTNFACLLPPHQLATHLNPPIPTATDRTEIVLNRPATINQPVSFIPTP